MSIFRISSFGDGLGDCFLIEISNEISTVNILVDGHRKISDDIKEKIENIDEIDYMVVTHIDADHIQGIIELLESENLKCKFENTKIIYNYISHPYINYKHANYFEKLIFNRRIIHTCKNHYSQENNKFLKLLSFNKRKEFTPPDDGCVYMTLLHPNQKKDVNEVYQDYLKKMKTTKVQPDSKLVNKHSIALMIEFNNKKALFTGDTSIDILMNKFNELKHIENCKVDLIKMPHHGSENENKGLVHFATKYECDKFIVTGEKNWKKKHPNEELLNSLNDREKDIKIYTKISGLPNLEYIEFKKDIEVDLV